MTSLETLIEPARAAAAIISELQGLLDKIRQKVVDYLNDNLHGERCRVTVPSNWHPSYNRPPRSAYALPLTFYAGLTLPAESIEYNRSVGEQRHDVAATCLKKFMRGLLSSNINYLEMLYSPAVSKDLYGLANSRKIFATKRVYQSLRGFALQQTKKKGEALDTKSILHAFRLLYMGIEFFVSGEFSVEINNFPCPLVHEVLNNTYTKNTFLSDFQSLLDALDRAYVSTSVREEPDVLWVKDFLWQVYKNQTRPEIELW